MFETRGSGLTFILMRAVGKSKLLDAERDWDLGSVKERSLTVILSSGEYSKLLTAAILDALQGVTGLAEIVLAS